MKRATISLPDELAHLVEDEARRRGTSVSEVFRQSLRESLLGSGPRALPFEALFDDPDMPAATDLEAELDETWSDDLDRGRR